MNKVVIMKEFMECFNDKDLDGIMKRMTSDCVYVASVGASADGDVYRGHEAVRKAFENLLKTYPDARFSSDSHRVAGENGNWGISEWTFSGSNKDGVVSAARGLDVFEFRDDLIHVKDSFKKGLLSR